MRRELFLAWLSAVWIGPIMGIGLYGFAYWHIWTWLPMLGYIGGTFCILYFLSEVRRVENRVGQDPDQRVWLKGEEWHSAIRKIWRRR